MTRQPRLTATNRALAELYYDSVFVTSADIIRVFGVSKGTAWRAMRFCREYARDNGIPTYNDPYGMQISVDTLFRAFNWDIEEITRKVERGSRILDGN